MKLNKTCSDLPAYSHPGHAGDTANTREGGDHSVLPLESWLLRKLLDLLGQPQIRILLWDGNRHYGPDKGESAATLVIHNRRALWRLFTNPNLNFGDDYSRGTLDVEGSLVELLVAIYQARVRRNRVNPLERFLTRGFSRRRDNTLSDSRENIQHHYDIGNNFYRLWLDAELSYTCAYFPTPDASLEQAQIAKMDHVCRKLELKPGERVVEAGCGWGSLARHMALHYGVEVDAYNISHEQVAYARRRANDEGFADKVRYFEDDYRNTQETDYDAFVSVGMLEHVGVRNYRTLGRVIDRVLSDNGRGLIHSIGKSRPEPTGAWTEKRLFPGGYSPALSEMMDIFQEPGFTVTDVENLRLHYAHTLENWLQRYEQSIDQVREQFDEFFVRAWRLYLAASQANFEAGSLQLYQVLFTRPMKNDSAWTRAHLYRDQSPTPE